MSKKSSHGGLRLLMGAGSIIGFVGGWAILGQTGNTYTVQPTENATVAPAASQAVSTNNSSTTNSAAVATAVPARTIVQITTQTTTTTSSTRTKQTTRLKTGGS